MMWLLSPKNGFEVLAGICINLTSGWFGILVISPGFFNISSFGQYFSLLTNNLPFGIVGLILSLWLTDRKNFYDER